MLPIFTTNANRLRELHARIHETFDRRSVSPAAYKDWQEACAAFRQEYDQLAFPGGYSRGIEKIRAGDLSTIVIALEYLENTPYCFRSQYVATRLRRTLNKVSLPTHLAERFENWKRSKKKSGKLK